MIEAVFISDLHLHPDNQEIQDRFNAFIDWAKLSTKSVYILGDFFHIWVGDDAIDSWSRGIANQIQELKKQGISVYYMHGNRDFLLDKHFAKLAGWELLKEPTRITLGSEKILLVHGDSFCTKDISHQRFRFLTRNKLFKHLFLTLPLRYRKKLAEKVRTHSKMNYNKPQEQMDVVEQTILDTMIKYQVKKLIHGHTHKPGLTEYDHNQCKFSRFVLSDWDDRPQILSYNITKGLHFNCFSGVC